MIYDLRRTTAFLFSGFYPVVPKDVLCAVSYRLQRILLRRGIYIKAFKEIKRKVDNDEYPHEMADFTR
jgi:hypothetical protein